MPHTIYFDSVVLIPKTTGSLGIRSPAHFLESVTPLPSFLSRSTTNSLTEEDDSGILVLNHPPLRPSFSLQLSPRFPAAADLQNGAPLSLWQRKKLPKRWQKILSSSLSSFADIANR